MVEEDELRKWCRHGVVSHGGGRWWMKRFGGDEYPKSKHLLCYVD